ncbi:MAG: signal recognition particle-docking protein FtsY [Bermanella sp.]
MFGWGKSKKQAEKKAALAEAAAKTALEESQNSAVEDNSVEEIPAITEASVEIVEQPETQTQPVPESPPEEPKVEVVAKADVKEKSKSGFFSRIKTGLSRTRHSFTGGLGDLLLGKKEIDDDLLEEIETQLLMADVGVAATQEIIKDLTERSSRKELKDSGALFEALKISLSDILLPCQGPLEIDSSKKPYVILMVGVNGVGKTTTIGKMSKHFQSQGKSVMLAAGDTFRAAAVEQLQAWGERNNVPVVAQHTGADCASVIFDAVQSAQAKGIDIVIADTAGRLQNKGHLMQELEKVVRVMKKLDDSAPHEVMLVLDAATGQNALSQAKIFQQVVGVTSVSLSKLDGTAKGGVIFAIAKELQLPVRFIGVGEQIDDLRPFDRDQFIDALFAKD